MHTLRKARIEEIDKGEVIVWVDENGIATHDSTYYSMPVLCMGAKVLLREQDALPGTMEISDDEWDIIQLRIKERRLAKKQ